MYPQTNILIVDDEEDLTISLERALIMEGFQVDITTSPLSALEMVKAKKYHILLIEIVIPEMDGIDLLEAIHNYDALTQAIMMTGHSTMDRIVRSMEKGAVDYLVKPFKGTEQVLEAVGLCEIRLKRWWDIMRSNFA